MTITLWFTKSDRNSFDRRGTVYQILRSVWMNKVRDSTSFSSIFIYTFGLINKNPVIFTPQEQTREKMDLALFSISYSRFSSNHFSPPNYHILSGIINSFEVSLPTYRISLNTIAYFQSYQYVKCYEQTFHFIDLFTLHSSSSYGSFSVHSVICYFWWWSTTGKNRLNKIDETEVCEEGRRDIVLVSWYILLN